MAIGRLTAKSGSVSSIGGGRAGADLTGVLRASRCFATRTLLRKGTDEMAAPLAEKCPRHFCDAVFACGRIVAGVS